MATAHETSGMILRAFFFLYFFISQCDLRRWTGSTRTRDDSFVLDISNVSKLGIWLLALCFGVALFSWKPKYLQSRAAIFLLAMFTWFLVIAPVAPDPSKSYLTLFTLMSPFALTFAYLRIYGTERFLRDLFYFQILFLVLCIATYFALPSFSRFLLWDGSLGPRLTGLGAHPNSVAAAAVLAGVLACSSNHFLQLTGKQRIFSYVVVLLTLVLTNSRTSMVAFAVGCLVYLLLTNRHRFLFSYFTFGGAVIVVLTFALFPDALTLLTRSGDVSELTTGTGRTYVWEQSWRLIAESPVYGYGYNSTWYIFNELAYILEQFVGGYVFPHSHNLFLQILLSGGFVALGLFLLMIASVLWIGFRLKTYNVVALLAAYMSYSMTEADGFFQYPETFMTLLAVSVALANHYHYIAGRIARSRSTEARPTRRHYRDSKGERALYE